MRSILLIIGLFISSCAFASITVTGTCTGTTSCTPSATKAGNLEISWSYRAASTTAPSLPTGWTNVSTNSSTVGASRSWRIACRVAQSSTPAASGTFTNATNLAIVTISGTGVTDTSTCASNGVGSVGTANSVSSATATYSALTMASSSNIAVLLMGSSTSGQTCMPASGTSKASSGDVNIGLANATGNWSSATCTITSSVTTEIVIEIKAETVLTACSSNCPTLVQDRNWRSNLGDTPKTPFTFAANLPMRALANNALLCGVKWDGLTTTLAVTDDKSNSWSALKTINDGSTRQLAIYGAFGVAAGTQALTLTFSAGPADVVFHCSEYYNVATASALDVSSGAAAVTGPAVAPGAMTTTQANDLIWTFGVIDNSICCGNGLALYSGVGTNYRLLANNPIGEDFAWDIAWGSSGAINPTMRVYQPANDSFLVASVALKSAAAGTAPTGMRIVHVCAPGNYGAGTFTIQCPATGNLMVALQAESITDNNLTALSDTDSNTWTKLTVTGCGANCNAYPQVWYSQNQAHPTPNSATISFTLASAVTASPVFYDVAGAATPTAFDTQASASIAQTTAGGTVLPVACPGQANSDTDHVPDITPGANTGGGIAFAVTNEGTGPSCGPIQAAGSGVASGYVFDPAWYPNESDNSADQGNSYAHKSFTGAATLDFGYHWANAISPATPGTSGTAVAVTFLAPAGAAATVSPPRVF